MTFIERLFKIRKKQVEITLSLPELTHGDIEAEIAAHNIDETTHADIELIIKTKAHSINFSNGYIILKDYDSAEIARVYIYDN